QLLTGIFDNFVSNVREIEIDFNDNNVTLTQKLCDVCDEKFAVFVFNLGAAMSGYFGDNLNASWDKSSFFDAKIQLMLTKSRDKSVQIATLSRAFYQFLKAIAYICSVSIW